MFSAVGFSALRLRLVIAMLLLVYLAHLLAPLGLMIWCVLGLARNGGLITWGLAALFLPAAVTLLLHQLKCLFERPPARRHDRVRLQERDAPRLFKNLRRICRVAHANLPRHVYVDATENARVILDYSWRYLFVRSPRDMTIGLGLVEAFDRTTFQGALAHEVGHLTQRSLSLSVPLYFSLRSAELFLHKQTTGWQRAILWVPRQLVRRVYGLLVESRRRWRLELEFEADQIAGQIVGRDALVRFLRQAPSATGVHFSHPTDRERLARACLVTTNTPVDGLLEVETSQMELRSAFSGTFPAGGRRIRDDEAIPMTLPLDNPLSSQRN